MSGDVSGVDPRIGWEVADDLCGCARTEMAADELFEHTDIGRILIDNMRSVSRITVFEPHDDDVLARWVMCKTSDEFIRHMKVAIESMHWLNVVFEPRGR